MKRCVKIPTGRLEVRLLPRSRGCSLNRTVSCDVSVERWRVGGRGKDVCLSVCLFVCLFVRLTVCLFVFLGITSIIVALPIPREYNYSTVVNFLGVHNYSYTHYFFLDNFAYIEHFRHICHIPEDIRYQYTFFIPFLFLFN